MAETIKERIKQNAFLRREKRLQRGEDQSIVVVRETNDVSHTDTGYVWTPSGAGNNVLEDVAPLESTVSTLSTSRSGPTILPESTISSSSFGPITLPTGSSSGSTWPGSLARPIQLGFGSVMIYLDYVFPFLFPFYQPSLLETGRQWLLGLLCQNEVSFHIAASLSAYFFTLVPQDNEEAKHDECKAYVRNKLVEQMDLAFRSMQATVSVITRQGAQCPLLDRTRVMEEITQLLIVEITVQRNVDWEIHLTPALVLFDEIFKSQGINHLEPSLAVLLSALPSSLPVAPPNHKPLPNTADQSALVFFVSLLLFVDIVASTSLGESPTLQNYHHSLLSSHGQGNCRLRLENIIGCQNWVLVAIGNISALCAWKRNVKQSGDFSVVKLVNLAEPISQALDEGFASLYARPTRLLPQNWSNDRLKAYYSRHEGSIDGASIAIATRIWAHATKIYLSVSLSGWQPNFNDIQASVTEVLALFHAIESPAQLRSLSWPICIAGCLASTSQEDEFRHIVGMMDQLGEFGTVFDALRIMEAVWRSRYTVDVNVWDIASCLRILGSPALLV